MVIDIDSFLENFKNNKVDDERKKIEKLDLDFQKEVESKLDSALKKVDDVDYNILKNIYLEVKDFDLDLTNKFLGIEDKSDESLKLLGEKYSKEFLERVKNNKIIISKNIDERLLKISKELDLKNFNNVIQLFEDLLKEYEKFPNEFIEDKLLYSSKIKNIELLLNKRIILFKQNDLKKIKIKIKKDLLELNSLLKPGNSSIIPKKISSIQYEFNTIPKIFKAELSEENILISKTIIKAEKYLLSEYQREFKEKKKILDKLFEKFHSYYIAGNVEKVVFTYDEILFQFNSLPNLFLEKKINIYQEINELYPKINKLLIKNQVSTFLESYNSSKIIEEVREYLRHANMRKSVNIENLKLLKNKLNLVSDKFLIEKNKLIGIIDSYLNKFEKINSKKMPNSSLKDGVNLKKKDINIKNIDNNKESSNDSNLTSSRENLGENLDNKSKLKTKSKIKNNSNPINQNIEEIKIKINDYYNIVRDSNDVVEIKKAYKKLIFYLDLIKLPKQEKEVIKLKVKKLLLNKKFKH